MLTLPLFGTLGLGVVLGLRHAADPDHLVALGALASRERRLIHTASLGLFWGLGHTVSLLSVGVAIALLGVSFPPAVSVAMELAVAVMLVGLGIRGLWKGRALESTPPTRSGWSSAAVGLVHGLGGSAALTLVTLSTIPHPPSALAYLAAFGIGSTIGMLVVTLVLAFPLQRAGHLGGNVSRWIVSVACVLSIAAGVSLGFELLT